MASLPWFRLYTEFAYDPKVQTMSESMQRRLVMLFCLRCSDQLDGLSEKEIAFALKISLKEWRKTKALFLVKGFLNEEEKFSNGEGKFSNGEGKFSNGEGKFSNGEGKFSNEHVSLKNFDQRQRGSDHSNSRMKKLRNSSKNADVENSCDGIVTDENRHCDGSVLCRIDKNRIDKNRTEENRREERTLMSGKPDATDFSEIKINPEMPKNSELKSQAREVLEFLNLKTGKKFRVDSDVNLKLIIARLKSGATVMQCRKVIAKKSSQWRADEQMSQYLRPKTLFGATNFEQYVGELVIIPEDQQHVR